MGLGVLIVTLRAAPRAMSARPRRCGRESGWRRGRHVPAPHSQVSLHITITLRSEGIGHKQTGPEAGEAMQGEHPFPHHPSFPQRFPWPEIQTFSQDAKRKANRAEEGVCQLKQSLGGLLGLQFPSWSMSFPLLPSCFPSKGTGRSACKIMRSHPEGKKECVNPMSSQHNQPLPQQKKPSFSEKKKKRGS